MTSVHDLLALHRAPMGAKPAASAERMVAVRELTRLMATTRGFSYVRLGDYDVMYLLTSGQAAGTFNVAQQTVSGTQAAGSPGLEPAQAGRLRSALERASYVDFWELQWKDGSVLRMLDLRRPQGALRNPGREASNLLPTWVEHEFKNYCQGRRVLFCGAEAPLLMNLLEQPVFRTCAKDVWPEQCIPFFLRPREDGRNLGKNLDGIRADIRDAVIKHRIDTLFLSLGGGAKILCAELASELGICAVDFGANMRALTYSGSDGNLAARSTHLVFFYRIPFGVFMDAVEKSYPELDAASLLAKAHAQILLEVQDKEVGWTTASWEMDFSRKNRKAFRVAHKAYRRRYHKLFNKVKQTKLERIGYLHFCGTHRLTVEGFWFLWWLQIKKLLGTAFHLLKRRSFKPSPIN